MVKMAHASLPKLLPITASNMCPKNTAETSLSEILQSDPVRRLLNQPNIVIKAIPLSTAKNSSYKKDTYGDRNGMNINSNNIMSPDISIVPIKSSNEEKEEDVNLLPSKIEDKKSEIALLPIKPKLCGHYEPCENIVCDVTVQQHMDQDGTSPMLAMNIEWDEINAPVAKHCKNEYCDALSIDHDRCRRALIKLHRCDKSCVCDICGITLKERKSRVQHRNCIRKNEYRHNNVDRVDLLKERMRERELQILESMKTKKNDYLDPVKGYSLAMETLRKNKELIIIPKSMPSQKPIITITSIPNNQSVNGANPSCNPIANINQPIHVNTQVNNLNNIVRNVPFALSPQSTSISPSNALHPEKNRTQSMNQVRLPNLQQTSYSVISNSVPTSVPIIPQQNQYVRLATPPTQTTTVQPITVNNWVVSPSHVITTTPIQPKSFLTPIRVVPITNLITAPSLLHRTQGIPKFCIMADNVITPLTIPNSPTLQTATTTASTVNVNVNINNINMNAASNIAAQQECILKVPMERILPKKYEKPKKKFLCHYCLKHFTTDWYFKLHVAKHKNEKLYYCNLCDESSKYKYDIQKHIIKKHDGQGDVSCKLRKPVYQPPVSPSKLTKTHTKLSPDRTDGKLDRHKEMENCKTFSVNNTNHHSLHKSNGVDAKTIKIHLMT